jgi:two-component system sensor histidine kinase QseC
MKRWLRPTLTRRVVIALLLAFVSVWSVLLAFDYLAFKQGMRTNSGLQQLSGALSGALAGVDDPDHARSAVAAASAMLNHLRKQGGQLPGELLFELTERDGRVVYRAAALGSQPLAGEPAQVREQAIGKRVYWVTRQDTPRWTLRVAEPTVDDTTVLGWMGLELIPYLLLAFPVVLAALWLAVRNGLRPLRLLAQRIEARRPDDLSPIGQRFRYEELQPLVLAFDNLLARLRRQVQREHAFVQDAAHELRTPMAVISTQAHVLMRAADSNARQQAQGHLDHAIARASHLVGQLLELATLDETTPPAPATVDVAHHLGTLLAQKAAPALARNIELSLEAPDTLPWSLDMAAFQSIVHNLLDNALRYVHEGCRIAVTASASAGTLTLSIADDGPGIAEDQRDLVFERFYRVGGNTAPGSGLGLAIVRQAVRRLGGTVGISAGLDQRGCTFHVRLGAHPRTI